MAVTVWHDASSPHGRSVAFDEPPLLPLPACGERVGVGGHLRKLRPVSQSLRRGPLTRNEREGRAHSDLSPQAGRGKAARLSLNLAPMAAVLAGAVEGACDLPLSS